MDQLKPLFLTAIARAKAYTGPITADSESDVMKKTTHCFEGSKPTATIYIG